MKPTDLHPATRAERPFRRGSDEEKLFLAAVKMIPKHYRSFDMGCVMDDLDECGTVCCFAGFVALLTATDLSHTINQIWTEVGPEQLGLEHRASERLFHSGFWPRQFRDRLDYLRPRTPEYAAAAVKRFMHFYRTGE